MKISSRFIAQVLILVAAFCSARAEVVLDVSHDYSTNSNPNPIWSYGYQGTLGGAFTPLPYSLIQNYGANSVVHRWLRTAAGGPPSVQKNIGTYPHISDGGQANIAPGVVWFGPGSLSDDKFCVIRCVIPVDGRYRLRSVVSTYLQGPISGDCDFHVLKNGIQLFGEFLPGSSGTSYSNTLQLVTGDIIDFVVGRGADDSSYASGLTIDATLTTGSVAPPPAISFDLSRDFSIASNPNGSWSYGWVSRLDGPFGLLTYPMTYAADNGVPLAQWLLSATELPSVAKNVGSSTAVSAGGSFTGPPGIVWFGPGADGTPQNFAVIRFTAPAGGDGDYRIETAVQSLFDGMISADADFHVVQNGHELFGEFLPPNSAAGYSNTVHLTAGSTIDFACGKGADGLTAHTGLKIRATLTRVDTPPPPPPPSGDCAPISPRGLVSWWRGEGDAKDSAGHNDGLLVNGVTFGPGKVGQGFVLDGNSYILVPDNPTLDLTDEITIEMWFKSEDWSDPRTWALLDKRTFNDCNYGVVVSEQWGFQLYYNDPNVFGGDQPGNIHEISSYYPLPTLHVFHHFAGTYRQVDPSHIELKTYLDGALVQTRVFSGNLGNTVNNMAVAIGSARGGADGGGFKGIIDEVALYNRALTADEVAAIYTADSAGKCAVPPPPPPPPPGHCAPISRRGLVAWWRGEGDAKDSGGHNDGLLVNGVTFGPGKVGQGFVFDGNSYILVPDNRTLDLTGEITMEMWFKSDEWGEGRTWALMDKRTFTDCNYGAVVSEPWGFQLYYNDPNVFGGDQPGNIHEISSYYPLPTLHVFHHFAGTYRQVDSSHIELKTYLDGALVQTRVFSGNLANTVNDMDLAIASARGGADGGAFKGIIDEIALYNRVLSANEIAAIYQADSAGQCPTPNPPHPHIKRSPEFVIDGAPYPFVIACDGQGGQVTLDGRESNDLEGDVLGYAWFAGSSQTPFSTAPVVTAAVNVGVFTVTLLVSDGQLSDSETTTFEVITPGEAAAQLSLLLEAADLSRKNLGPLQEAIRAAIHSLERGKIKTGINQLEAFENKVQAQLGSDHPGLAASLSAATEALIEALGNCSGKE